MIARHIFEGVIESGLFDQYGVGPEDARPHGIVSEAKGLGMKPIADLDPIWAKCESPIEKVLAAAMVYSEWPTSVEIRPQEVVGNYRLDFMVDGGDHKIDVECDGAEFHHHNITMAKYQADRMRDRFMQRNSMEVLRFTGTEIWVNPLGCAHEVTALMSNMIEGAL